MQNILNYILVPIHKEGIPFILIFAITTLLLSMVSASFGWVGAILTGWCVYFFRNPDRVTPTSSSLVVSPGDGQVSKITPASPPEELGMGEEQLTRVSIFLSVFDVHVNRIPANGKIKTLHYRPGAFLNATLDKASEKNERQSLLMTTDDGKDIAFVQIAGLIARRIVCNVDEGQDVKAGERFGIIRFGSRVDVYLPKGIEPLVIEGQRVIGGETILADLAGEQVARQGEVR